MAVISLLPAQRPPPRGSAPSAPAAGPGPYCAAGPPRRGARGGTLPPGPPRRSQTAEASFFPARRSVTAVPSHSPRTSGVLWLRLRILARAPVGSCLLLGVRRALLALPGSPRALLPWRRFLPLAEVFTRPSPLPPGFVGSESCSQSPNARLQGPKSSSRRRV